MIYSYVGFKVINFFQQQKKLKKLVVKSKMIAKDMYNVIMMVEWLNPEVQHTHSIQRLVHTKLSPKWQANAVKEGTIEMHSKVD